MSYQEAIAAREGVWLVRERSCSRPEPVVSGPGVGPADDWPEHAWIQFEDEARDQINAFLGARPGVFLSWYTDDVNQIAVIVFDQSVPDPVALVAEFEQTVVAPFKVVFRPGCYPLAELEPIWSRALELWRPYQEAVAIQGAIDPALGRQVIMLSPDAPKELVDALKAEFGDLIVIEYGEGLL